MDHLPTKEHIKIFITGGTFDKWYNELTGELFFKETHVPEMLRLGRSRLNIDVTTLMMMDSLDMTSSDKDKIIKNCIETEEDKIIITHGTDTMVETAQLIHKNIKNKTIVLTGALIPYKFGSSDGFFNLGCALAYVQTLPKGVYIAMNGKYFHWDNVIKNKQTGDFVLIKE